MEIRFEKLKVQLGGHAVLHGVSLFTRERSMTGLIGPNGCGKSTLIKSLFGIVPIQSGDIFLNGRSRKKMRQRDIAGMVGYVGQDSSSLFDFTVREIAEMGLFARKANLTRAEKDDIVSEALETLHIADMQYRNVQTLSGGERKMAFVARTLVQGVDTVILDEPTNHLDIVMSEWLEKYLREFRGGVLVISHDRAFLDNVVEEILEMEGGTIHRFKGNYSRYLEQKEIQVLTQTRAYEAQQEYIARQEAYIRRFKAGIKSKMARGRQSQLDRLERIDAPVQEEEFELRLPPAAECAEKVIMLEHLDVGYPQHRLLQDVDLTLRRGEKVAIIGPNGCGKSTLLKTILQELPPLKGEARVGNRVKIGYFSQSYERLDEKQTIMENFLTEYGMTDEQTRRLLGSMMFHGEDVFKVIGTLSGGQKARLVLLKLVLDGANCLLLDEPTNHLDIAAKEAVEAALETFDGTVLLVSHDRYLVNEVAGRIWAVENGHVTDYKGNYDFYLEERDKNRAREGADAPAAPRKEEKKAAKPAPEKTAPEAAKTEKKTEKKPYSPAEAQKLLPQVELKIREYEALQKVLSDRIADPANQQDLETSTRLAEEYAEQEKILDGLMDKWEKLMESLE